MDTFVICVLVCLCFTILCVPCSLMITCWEWADLLALLCVMFTCVFCHFSIWCPASGMVLDFISHP